MPREDNSTVITVCDIFAGAGGSSSGMHDVPGVEVKLAANHWQLAVDVHQQNHPDTDHACVDLHLEDPYSTDRPMRTVTTRENHGLLVPYYSASETAKPTTEPVGTLTTVDRYAMVTLRGTNAPKPVSQPLDTVAANGNHHGLINTDTIDPEDCTFRMLEPHEIAMGMSFPQDYKWSGTKRERVRMAGNAVTPPAARDIITAITQVLEPA